MLFCIDGSLVRLWLRSVKVAQVLQEFCRYTTLAEVRALFIGQGERPINPIARLFAFTPGQQKCLEVGKRPEVKGVTAHFS